MREIKFRAWDNENNKFFETIHKAYEGKIEELNINLLGGLWMRTMSGHPIGELAFPNRFEIMQYTGLHDKAGKDIYESDIVEINDGRIYEVAWDKYGFSMFQITEEKNRWGKPLKSYPRVMFTNKSKFYGCVIGNIWENKELLK
jgi:uncharacterized phage protein (TIGR01671 family)